MTTLDDVAGALAAIDESQRRTILCHPDHETTLRAWLEEHDPTGRHRLVASPYAPTHRIYVMHYRLGLGGDHP